MTEPSKTEMRFSKIIAEGLRGAGMEIIDAIECVPVPIFPNDAFVEKVAAKIAHELDVVEAVLADPLTIRRIRAMRIVRATLKAVAEVGNE